jgi:hypothetical protein
MYIVHLVGGSASLGQDRTGWAGLACRLNSFRLPSPARCNSEGMPPIFCRGGFKVRLHSVDSVGVS